MDSKTLRSIKLRHLSAFVETVRHGSLKAGAARVHLTQSAISKAIKDLEATLGVVLLKRDRSGIELTQEGAVFRRFAEQGLATINHGLMRIEALSKGHDVPVRVGALPSVAADYLPKVIQRFSKLSPNTPVSVEDGPIGSLINKLRTGELESVLGRMGHPETMVGVSFTQLYTEHVVFAAASDHPLARESDLAKLDQSLVLYPPPGAAIRPIVDRFVLTQGLPEWPNRLETVSGAFGRAMALGPSRAIWIISQGVVAQDLEAGRMVALPVETRSMSGPVGVMARSEEDPTPTLRLFREALLEVAQERAQAQ